MLIYFTAAVDLLSADFAESTAGAAVLFSSNNSPCGSFGAAGFVPCIDFT
jgi:hypothetical protein